jgi:glycosyltransferase involved in cell wall biosynthesis
MHVAICSDGVFPAAMGGMERHTKLLVESLAARDPSLRISVVHTHPGQRFFERLANVVERPIAPKPGRRQYLLECVALSSRFAAELRAMPDAIVYSQGVCVIRGIREFSDRLIVNPHGLESFQTLTLAEWSKSAPFRVVQQHTFRHARFVVSLGGKLTEILARQVRPSSKISVIPNGVVIPCPASIERPIRSAADPVRLLFVGRLAPNKGVPDLLMAIDELARRGHAHWYELDIVGGGPLLESLMASNSRPNVRFRGKVDDSTLESLYSEADALALPTRFEGMPTVVLEAMARALPVLVTDVGATRELVDNANGEIIPIGNPGTLADAVERLRSLGPGGRRALGEAGARRAAERFTWDRVADMHLELFARVSSGR